VWRHPVPDPDGAPFYQLIVRIVDAIRGWVYPRRTPLEELD